MNIDRSPQPTPDPKKPEGEAPASKPLLGASATGPGGPGEAAQPNKALVDAFSNLSGRKLYDPGGKWGEGMTGGGCTAMPLPSGSG